MKLLFIIVTLVLSVWFGCTCTSCNIQKRIDKATVKANYQRWAESLDANKFQYPLYQWRLWKDSTDTIKPFCITKLIL